MIEIEYMASSMILFCSTWSNAFSVKYRKIPRSGYRPFCNQAGWILSHRLAPVSRFVMSAKN